MRRPAFLSAWAGTLRRRWQVGDAARQLVEQHGITSLEGLDGVAVRLGFPVEYRVLPRNSSGWFQPIDETFGVIVINSARTPLHQHYTLAHELAHALLHFRPSYPMTQQQKDRQADVFAFVCLSLSVPEADILPHVLHNLDLGRKVIPIMIFIQVGRWLNTLADWLDPQAAQPSPSA